MTNDATAAPPAEARLEVTAAPGPSFRAYQDSFSRHLLARNVAPATIEQYRRSVQQLTAFCRQLGMPGDPTALTREHVETFLVHLLKTRKAATADVRFKALRVFFHWLRDEGEIRDSPMRNMRDITVPQEPPKMLDASEVLRILEACRGEDFESVRDTAIVRLLVDTGLRRGELLGLRMQDIDWDLGIITMVGKGRNVRQIPYGYRAGRDLDRYVRRRSREPWAEETDALWPLNKDSLRDLINRRAEQAGLEGVTPHMFRHTFAHLWLEGDGQEQDLMRIGGWRSEKVMRRYGALLADKRAHLAHRRYGPGDRLGEPEDRRLGKGPRPYGRRQRKSKPIGEDLDR